MAYRAIAWALLVVLLFGCATTGQNGQRSEEPSPAKSAGAGAIIGGIIGAVVGGLVGGRDWALIGAAAGAALGGITGYAWGEYQRRTVMTRDEAVQAVGYTPDQGHKLVIRQTYAAPDPIKRGASVRLGGNYAVLAPDPSTNVQVKEIREILYNDAVVFKASEREALINQGGEESDEEFRIPTDASEGQYTYRLTIVDPANNVRETKESTFTVIKG